MITICPQCQLSLAVSAADLRVAQGHVRCGRCASVFNALVTLFDSEADAVPSPAPPALQDGNETRIFEVRIDTAATDAGANTGVFERAPVAEADAGIDLAADPDATGERPIDLDLAAAGAEPVVLAEPAIEAGPADLAEAATASPVDLPVDLPVDPLVEPPILPTDAAPLEAPVGATPEEPLAANDELVDAPPAANDEGIDEVAAANDPIASTETVDIDLGALAPPAIEDWRVVPQSADAALPAQTLPIIDLDPPAEAAVEVIEPAEEAAVVEGLGESPRPRYYWAYAAGAAFLALALVAQLIHQQREALVAWPRLAGPLSAFYASIGQPIALRGDLAAYDVRQLGAVAAPDTAGTLLVRASLRNLSPRPQPMPLLRVTLQDRYGNRIASRDLTAAEYEQRPRGRAPRALLAAGARLETAVQLVDPGGNAVGFELDACLSERGTTRCANDVTTATAAR